MGLDEHWDLPTTTAEQSVLLLVPGPLFSAGLGSSLSRSGCGKWEEGHGLACGQREGLEDILPRLWSNLVWSKRQAASKVSLGRFRRSARFDLSLNCACQVYFWQRRNRTKEQTREKELLLRKNLG